MTGFYMEWNTELEWLHVTQCVVENVKRIAKTDYQKLVWAHKIQMLHHMRSNLFFFEDVD